MAKEDLGIVTFMPWTNLYPFFTTKVSSFSGEGGYHIENNKCFILLNGSVSGSITLPTPVTSFDLSFIKNSNVAIQKGFNGVVNLSSGDTIHIEIVYEV